MRLVRRGLLARGEGDFGDGEGRRRIALVELRLESGPIGLSVDDQVKRVVLVAVDRALRQQRVVEGGNPLRGVAVAGHDRRETTIPFNNGLYFTLSLAVF